MREKKFEKFEAKRDRAGMNDDKDKGRLEQQIDDNLRKVYQRHLEEEVPDRFTDLLAKLKEADEKGSAYGK